VWYIDLLMHSASEKVVSPDPHLCVAAGVLCP